MNYSIDTSAILEGWVRFMPQDVVPGLWEKMSKLSQNGQLVASEEVIQELKKKDDGAYEWAKKNIKTVPIDDNIQVSVSEILKTHRKLIDECRNRSGADPFVIALAKINGHKLVTCEQPTGKPNRPHIPDVCNDIGVPYIDLIALCREQKWSFK